MMRESYRGFFCREPAPHGRAFRAWSDGAIASTLLLVSSSIIAVLALAFWLGRWTA
jgi:hypothetical protein